LRIAITDYKLPQNPDPSAQPRGVMPFTVDEKAVKVGLPKSQNVVTTFWDNSDYYPYGMLIAERSWQAGGYRYGYNGKENDNEVKGTGNSIDYGARIYDPRVARFQSPDPLKDRLPGKSNYMYAGNNPIVYIDYQGGFELSPTLQEQYPRTTLVLKSMEKLANDEALLKAFEDWTGMPGGKLIEDLKFDEGPEILVDDIKNLKPGFTTYGYFNPDLYGKNSLVLDKSLLDDLESALEKNEIKIIEFLIVITTLHEDIHLNDYLEDGRTNDGAPANNGDKSIKTFGPGQPVENGHGFEKDLLGIKDIGPEGQLNHQKSNKRFILVPPKDLLKVKPTTVTNSTSESSTET